jgi:hypothetical protein
VSPSLQWTVLLAGLAAAEEQAVGQRGLDTCGLALEHLLQIAYRPVLSGRRRGTAGDWRVRDLDFSRSRGAISSGQLPGLFQAVKHEWDALIRMRSPAVGQPTRCTAAGRVVFPVALLQH